MEGFENADSDLDRSMPAGEMRKIRLRFWDDNKRPVITKWFTGRWLVGGEGECEGVRTADDSQDWDAGAEWSVAQTSRGNLVAYVQHCSQRWAPSMTVHESFDDLKNATDEHGNTVVPHDIVQIVADALRVPYEIELDI